ncbi:MAG: hypothetical protein M1832_004202 [Thelocarpon impressellum]|nr:MAG: hypothetical protein M1832_004202 [Thelocarpon impressellum]
MPGLVRKLLIFAAVDGLVLQPVASRQQRGPAAVRIGYGSYRIEALPKDREPERDAAAFFESHGIIGLLSVSTSSFLICISGRRQVAQIRGRPVYVVTDVALIPLSSQTEANAVIVQTRDRLGKLRRGGNGQAPVESDSSEDEGNEHIGGSDQVYDDDDLTLPTASEDDPDSLASEVRASEHKRRTSVAEDVIGRKGLYGRFAGRWFSKKGWNVEKRRLQGMSGEDSSEVGDLRPDEIERKRSPGTSLSTEDTTARDPTDANESSRPERRSLDVQRESVTSTLLPKLLRTTKMLFGSQNFFFSYDCDITRSPTKEQERDLPMHQAVDPLYFWNRHVMVPFMESRQHAYVLPLMQGFVGQCTLKLKASKGGETSVVEAHMDEGDVIELQNKAGFGLESDDERDFLLTLVSRRSVERAGLRYLRRGVDEQGHAANSVETEQVLSSPSWSLSEKLYSFVQVRGSIPLFFSQSPYSFRPDVVLQRSPQTNHAKLTKHFQALAGRYGGVQVVSLVSKHGTEAKIGEEYEKGVASLNEDGGSILNGRIGFEWFDFHDVCRGMKFENVRLLLDTLGAKLDEYGQTVELDREVIERQRGVLRTNCMDCLDRTNVVQSACGRRALEKQLREQGFDLELQADKATQWFNTLWADNGDAISRQYTSTAALKGDYTRTRKRDYRGALNDLGLSVSRYFNNIVNDYFSQAAIDYLLGNVTAQVFEEFEADMMSGDPATSMSELRQNAVDTAARIVIADKSEELLGGWTLLAPQSPNSLRTFPFSETALLLTTEALYKCVFAPESPLEKVSSFTRIPLSQIQSIHHGTYITSTLAPAHTLPERNVGFVVTYSGTADDVRVNTRAMSVSSNDASTLSCSPSATSKRASTTAVTGPGAAMETTRIQAFKAIPQRSSHVVRVDGLPSLAAVTEAEVIRGICGEVKRAANAATKTAEGETSVITSEQRDVISLAEAQRSTGLLEQLGHELKKMVWA